MSDENVDVKSVVNMMNSIKSQYNHTQKVYSVQSLTLISENFDEQGPSQVIFSLNIASSFL